jgi:orotidine-5'-phosphate decarboxylase
MLEDMRRKIICALDTPDLDEALGHVRRLRDYVGAFKIGHALTLNHGLDVVDRLQDAGADRIFLDLKFHDIPNSVGLAVREAARHHVWMMTLHLSGGPAMIQAAVAEASMYGEREAPLLVGVSVLTSLDQHILTDHLGIGRSVSEQVEYLSKMGVDSGLDGVVCSVEEVSTVRSMIGKAVTVVPGIRPNGSDTEDQRRVGDAATAFARGADYIVVGRVLTGSPDPDDILQRLGITPLGA